MQSLNRSALLSDIGMTPALKHARSGKLSPLPHHPDVERGPHLLRGASRVRVEPARARISRMSTRTSTRAITRTCFSAGQFNHDLWLDMPAIDLQPLPKYLIGLVFRVAQFAHADAGGCLEVV